MKEMAKVVESREQGPYDVFTVYFPSKKNRKAGSQLPDESTMISDRKIKQKKYESLKLKKIAASIL